MNAQPHTHLIIGTYNADNSNGLFVYSFDYKSGNALRVSNNADISNASYFAITKNGKYVYAVSEEGNNMGKVHAYSFDNKSQSLKSINSILINGDAPCYIALNKDETMLTTANYTSGSLSLVKINEDGSLDSLVQVVKHSGKSTHTKRQKSPHVHSTVFQPGTNNVWVADLGRDEVSVFNVNDKLIITDSVKMQAGSGPRHIAFNEKKNCAYIINEINATITVVKYNGNKISKKVLQTINILPKQTSDDEGAADIHLHPDGKFLYATTRGQTNEITTFKVNKDGTLQYITSQSTLGVKPRNFYIEPKGKYLFVANQSSDEIVIFKINKKTGVLTDTGSRINIQKPVCVNMMP